MKDTPHVPLRQIAEDKIRGKELKVVQHVLDARRGMNGRDDKSSGIEILMTDVLGKINPTDPLILS